MSVAQSQLKELLVVLKKYLGSAGNTRNLLTDLTGTEAYRRNQSFRITVDSLKEVIEDGRSVRHDRAG